MPQSAGWTILLDTDREGLPGKLELVLLCTLFVLADLSFQPTLWLSIYVVGLVVDVAISALGSQVVLGLQMSVAKKIFVTGVFVSPRYITPSQIPLRIAPSVRDIVDHMLTFEQSADIL